MLLRNPILTEYERLTEAPLIEHRSPYVMRVLLGQVREFWTLVSPAANESH